MRLILLPALLALACAAAEPAAPPAPTPLKVLTYNIRHGQGMDNKVDLERIADVIRKSGADVVALQEVDRNMGRTQRRDLAAELGKALGFKAHFSPNLKTKDGGEYGNALLTRLPVKAWKNTVMKMERITEPRGLLQMTVEFQGREIEILTTHLDSAEKPDERLVQIPQIFKAIAELPAERPVVLCGDFNDPSDGSVYRQLAEKFSEAWKLIGEGPGLTFPSNEPRIRIDYFWTNPAQLRPLKVEIPNTLASDHLPLYAEFELRAPVR